MKTKDAAPPLIQRLPTLLIECGCVMMQYKEIPMRMTKIKVALFVVLIISIIFSVIYTFAVGSHYDINTNIYLYDLDREGVYAEYENEGVVELSDTHLSNNSIEKSKELVFSFDAVSQGKTKVRVYYSSLTSEDQRLREYRDFEFMVTGSGILFDTTGFYFNFQAYPVLLIVLMLDLAIMLVILLLTFFDYKRDGDFNYKMIGCAGLFVFFGVLLLMLVYKWLNQSLKYFSNFMTIFLDIGFEIFLLISPFMLLLSLLLAISNIWLMRHESFRPVNALGILFGVLWAGATAICLSTEIIPSVHSVFDTKIIIRTVLYLSCYFGSMFLATVICAYLATRYKPPYDRDYIIILGCGIREDGTLMPLLKGRVDAALQFEKEQYEKTGKHAIFVPSGGQGPDEVISESQAMTNYLLEQGIDRERILMEDKSVNTMQNMQFSRAVIENHAESFSECKIAFATTNYHIFRGYILAKKNGFVAKGISSKTKFYFYPNAFLREFIGLIVDQKFRHIAFTALTIIVFVVFDQLSRVL